MIPQYRISSSIGVGWLIVQIELVVAYQQSSTSTEWQWYCLNDIDPFFNWDFSCETIF